MAKIISLFCLQIWLFTNIATIEPSFANCGSLLDEEKSIDLLSSAISTKNVVEFETHEGLLSKRKTIRAHVLYQKRGFITGSLTFGIQEDFGLEHGISEVKASKIDISTIKVWKTSTPKLNPDLENLYRILVKAIQNKKRVWFKLKKDEAFDNSRTLLDRALGVRSDSEYRNVEVWSIHPDTSGTGYIVDLAKEADDAGSEYYQVELDQIDLSSVRIER